MRKTNAYHVALSAILCAQAVALNFLESFIPAFPFLPPGAKPGFSNIITMFAVAELGLPQAIIITLVKSGFAFVTRGVTAGAMSLSGGLLSTFTMYFLMKYAGKRIGLIGISVISAVMHNFGQLMTSVFITGSSKTFYYAPALAVFAIVTGIVTGVIFRAVLPALEKQKKYFFRT